MEAARPMNPDPHAPLFPMMLRLAQRRVVVIGGSNLALEKVRALRTSRAKVTVVAETLCDELGELITRGEIAHIARPYREGDLAGVRLAISALGDETVNRAIAAEADRRGVLLNVVDVPALCEFTSPSVVRRGDLVIAVSTSGRAPGAAAALRRRLEAQLGPECEDWMELIAQTRCRLKTVEGIGYERRREILNAVMDLDLLPLLREGRHAEAKKVVDQCVSRLLA